MIQPILLAAGRSRRFGANKLLCPLADGIPVALAAANRLVAALPGALAVVSGEDAALIAMLERAGLRTSVCPNADEGMGTSLAWGVRETAAADGWLIALADMPFITAATIQAVAAALAGPMTIVAPSHLGRRGHPVAFGRGHGPELARLRGDGGARSLLRAHAARVIDLPGDDRGILHDIDLQADISNPAD